MLGVKMKSKWTISVDLDGVLCEQGPVEKYSIAKPIYENIKKVNRIYDMGWNIMIHTGRSWASYDLTKAWLKQNGVRHTELIMGKLVAHYYIDDRNSTLDEVLKFHESDMFRMQETN